MSTLLLLWRAALRAWRPLALTSLLLPSLLALWLLCQMFGRLPSATHAFPTHSYWAFLAPALAVVAVAPTALLAGGRLLEDWRTGALERWIASATWLGGPLLAESLAVAGQALIAAPLVLLVSVDAGLHPDDPLLDLLALAGLSVVLGLAGAGCSALLAILTLDLRALRIGAAVILLACVVCSQLLLPASLLPGWLTWLAGGSPFGIAVDEAHRLFAPAPRADDYLHAMLVTGGFAVCANAAAILVFTRHPERGLAYPR